MLQAVLDTPVSPELLPPDANGGISQKTEDLIGPYELHDFFLFALLRLGAGPRKMLFLAAHAFAGALRRDDGPPQRCACSSTASSTSSSSAR